eukprot:769103-Lingulodinium_polyedra.AAC.1
MDFKRGFVYSTVDLLDDLLGRRGVHHARANAPPLAAERWREAKAWCVRIDNEHTWHNCVQ